MPPLWTAVLAIALLIVLVTRLRLNPVLALMLAALAVAVAPGIEFGAAVQAFQSGLGATLGGIAMVIALGAMLGRLLADSGGADVLARRFHQVFGPGRAVLCIMVLSLVVGIVTWFAVGLYLLLPILFTLTRESGKPLMVLALPMLSFLSVMHGLMPPHPGPVVAIREVGADTGLVLMWGLIVGVPVALLGGPSLARFVVPRLGVGTLAPGPPEGDVRHAAPRAPGFLVTLVTVLLPVLLMLGATAVDLLGGENHAVGVVFTRIGNPTIALLLAVLLALWTLGVRCGLKGQALLRSTEACVNSVGMTLLVVGAGGGFAAVLREAGVAESMGDVARAAHLPPLLFGWLAAAFVRVATGSATVGVTVAAGLVAGILPQYPDTNPELLIIALGSGSLNDGGFWIVRDTLGLTVGQTLRSWTVLETVVALAGLVAAMALDCLF
jgi:GntP family gluconate:H+ symporter